MSLNIDTLNAVANFLDTRHFAGVQVGKYDMLPNFAILGSVCLDFDKEENYGDRNIAGRVGAAKVLSTDDFSPAVVIPLENAGKGYVRVRTSVEVYGESNIQGLNAVISIEKDGELFHYESTPVVNDGKTGEWFSIEKTLVVPIVVNDWV